MDTASQGSLRQPFILLHTIPAQSLSGLNTADLMCTWEPRTLLELEHHSRILDITHNPKNQNFVNIRLDIPNIIVGGRRKKKKKKMSLT